VARPRKRIDILLVELGLAPTRSRAQSLLMAGKVLVDDVPVDKAGALVAEDADVRLKGQDHPYVSRGGVKLEGALRALGVDPRGWHCLDLGASTGGFTDCLLQHGAVHVTAVDVGTAQLHQRLLADPRVRSLERTDVRDLRPEHLPTPPRLCVGDLSFIGLHLVLPPVLPLLERPAAQLLLLVKPQFEVGRQHVEKGGVVRDPERREEAIQRVIADGEALGLVLQGRAESGLPGAKKGNVEEFVLFGLSP